MKMLSRSGLRRMVLDVPIVIGRASDFPKPRDYAYCELLPSGDIRIVVAPKFADAPAHRQDALICHERGHAALMILEQFEHTERDADAMAEALFNVEISYDADDVQTTGHGTRPRPNHLPR